MTLARLSVRLEEPLSRHTALRTGGPADAYVVAHDEAALAVVTADCRAADWHLTVLGFGTRTLVRDGGVGGCVVRLGVDFQRVTVEGGVLEAGAGAPAAALVSACIAHGLTGLAWLASVPGSVGASVVYDAPWSECEGAEAEIFSAGKARWRPLGDVNARSKGIVTRVRVPLAAGSADAERAAVRKVLLRGGPMGRAGSVWLPLGRKDVRKVVREAELPLVRLRAVAVPEAAHELLVNLGGGTARDLLLLQRSVIDRVKARKGEKLEPAIRQLGRREGAEGA